MKIKIGEKVYLQKYEIEYIMRNLNSFPMGVIKELLDGKSEDEFFLPMGNLEYGLNFEYAFDNRDVVEWLMSQDWIIDYDEYAGMAVADLESLAARLDTERYDMMRKFNDEDEEYREKYLNEECDKFSRLDHKAVSFRRMAAFRNGKLNFVFPGGCIRRSVAGVFGNAKMLKKSNLSALSNGV